MRCIWFYYPSRLSYLFVERLQETTTFHVTPQTTEKLKITSGKKLYVGFEKKTAKLGGLCEAIMIW